MFTYIVCNAELPLSKSYCARIRPQKRPLNSGILLNLACLYMYLLRDYAIVPSKQTKFRVQSAIIVTTKVIFRGISQVMFEYGNHWLWFYYFDIPLCASIIKQ